MCKVSIVLPTYNRAAYLAQAIESVLCQTMRDAELIVVDDGSTDETADIIARYPERLRYVRTENRGPAHARNIGMRMAAGEYISFLDSDDLYYPDKSRLQTGILDSDRSLGFVFSNMSVFDDHGRWEECYLRNYHPAYDNESLRYEAIYARRTTLREIGFDDDRFAKAAVYSGDIFPVCLQHVIVFTNSMMLRRSVIEKIGLQDEGLRLFEEMEFALRIAKQFPVAFLDLPTYKLRFHSRQMSSTSGAGGLQTLIEKQRNLLHIVERHALRDARFYARNKELVDKRLAVLYKYLAIPEMTSQIHAPRDVRELLSKCSAYGTSERLLWLITFMPYVFRRVIMKALHVSRYV